MGGAVGEVHGAKLTGLFERAIDHALPVVLLLESGGVRLHEANAGLIAVSETMRALLDARAAGGVGGRPDRQRRRLLRRHGPDRGVLRHDRDVRGGTARHVGARGDRDEARRRGVRLCAIARWCGARPAASIATCSATRRRSSTTTSRRSAMPRSRRLGHRRPMTVDGLLAEQAVLATADRDASAASRDARIWNGFSASRSRATSRCSSATRSWRSPTGIGSRTDMAITELLDRLFASRGTTSRSKATSCAAAHASRTAQVAVVGTVNDAAIGVELALALATEVLATVRDHPGRAIVLLVDTQGQRLRHRDELLGINVFMAHLAQCIEVARRAGHRVVSLVHGRAVSGAGHHRRHDGRRMLRARVRGNQRDEPARDGACTKILRERLEVLSRRRRRCSRRARPTTSRWARSTRCGRTIRRRRWPTHCASRPGAGADQRRALGRSRGGRTMAGLEIAHRAHAMPSTDDRTKAAAAPRSRVARAGDVARIAARRTARRSATGLARRLDRAPGRACVARRRDATRGAR